MLGLAIFSILTLRISKLSSFRFYYPPSLVTLEEELKLNTKKVGGEGVGAQEKKERQ